MTARPVTRVRTLPAWAVPFACVVIGLGMGVLAFFVYDAITSAGRLDSKVDARVCELVASGERTAERIALAREAGCDEPSRTPSPSVTVIMTPPASDTNDDGDRDLGTSGQPASTSRPAPPDTEPASTSAPRSTRPPASTPPRSPPSPTSSPTPCRGVTVAGRCQPLPVPLPSVPIIGRR